MIAFFGVVMLKLSSARKLIFYFETKNLLPIFVDAKKPSSNLSQPIPFLPFLIPLIYFIISYLFAFFYLLSFFFLLAVLVDFPRSILSSSMCKCSFLSIFFILLYLALFPSFICLHSFSFLPLRFFKSLSFSSTLPSILSFTLFYLSVIIYYSFIIVCFYCSKETRGGKS